MIALLSGIALTGSASAGHVLATVGKLALFIVVALMVGLLIVPRLLGYVARFNSNEMLLITVGIPSTNLPTVRLPLLSLYT